MARLDLDLRGLDEVSILIDRMGRRVDGVAKDMLMAGAAVTKDVWQKAIVTAGHVDTGSMRDSITILSPVVKKNYRTITIMPMGKDSNNVANDLKVNALNYGTSKGKRKIRPSHFVQFAREDSKEPATAAMLEIWNTFLDENL